MTIRTLSLFAGIGGFDLGLERTGGFKIVGQCEIDPFCQKVLKKHWPEVWLHDDITTLTAKLVRDNCGPVECICGGFPCQDISIAGKGIGLSGKRSGLWSEFRRLIEECSPDFAIIENVPRLRSLGLDQVLREISEIGYDAEWHCIPACIFGAPHRRDRIWIIANSKSRGLEQRNKDRRGPQKRTITPENWARSTYSFGWEAEPAISRIHDGLPNRVDRTRAIGNAVVPQVVTAIGTAILHQLDASKKAGDVE